MAEAVVSFVVERVGDLLISEAKSLYGVSDQVEQVQAELQQLRGFLKDADAKQDENETIHNLVAEIREVAYDAEDCLETFALKVASRRRRGGIKNILKRFACILNEGTALCGVGSEIKTLKTKIAKLTTSLQTYGIRAIMEGEGSSSMLERLRQLRRSYSHLVEDDFVGLEQDVQKLVALLVNEDKDNYYRVVSICGMGGLGKTTLAQKVYNHSDVRRHFDCLVWTCISQKWQTKDVLQGILIKLVPDRRKEIMEMREEEIVRLLVEVQQEKNCLIVLDDIWTVEAWGSLRSSFPSGNMGGKILVTSRNREVALRVDPIGFLHEPKYLNEEESWELLRKKAFPSRHGTEYRVDTNIEKLGREMVGRCGGLPLAIVVPNNKKNSFT